MAVRFQSDQKRNRAKFTQFPMNSLAVSSSCSSSRLLSRFQCRGRIRGRYKYLNFLTTETLYETTNVEGLDRQCSGGVYPIAVRLIFPSAPWT
ncbi:hypothetical protein D1AOALGA4SA_12560 [Olavius algarvensis Delta 1 endosymbiont]|nr:hypothetical protein D1AOALGA4SA_12560 [Olavius algarvensis Delta 1 endosymbiont]